MSQNRILLALTDKEDIRVLTGYLSGVGFELSLTEDGAAAVERSMSEVPTIMIVDMVLPIIDGERLFKIVRHNPHTSKIPFIFISNNAVDIKGFKPGLDSFVSRPLNLEQVDGRLRQAMFQREDAHGGAKGIEGRLSHMSPPDIIQFLHMNKKEGELKLTLGSQVGHIYIKEGDIYNAVFEGVEKEKALYRLLEWNEGGFEFMPKTVDAPKKIHSSTSNLLMEGMRQIDEVKRIKERFPDQKNLLKMKVEPANLPKDLDPVIYDIVKLMKVYARVKDLVDRCPLPDYEVYWTLTEMLSRGFIEEQKASDAETKQGFLSPDQTVNIRERIINNFTGIGNYNYAKIFLLSTSSVLVDAFLDMCCTRIPGLTLTQKTFLSEASVGAQFGEVASIKLQEGMDIVIFSLPIIRNMGPVVKSFSTNLVGLILLWDDDVGADLNELVDAKKEMVALKKCPVVHVFAGEGEKVGLEISYRKMFMIKDSEPIFKLRTQEKGIVFDIFNELFGDLLKQGVA